jgi:ribosome maturation factor RimP
MAESMGYGVVDAEFVMENANWFLRVFLDKAGGITIDDCERFSRAFSDALDRDDFIPRAYVLEVSSPGVDRPLATGADFLRHSGELVEAWLTRAEAKRRRLEKIGTEDYISGTLISRDGGILRLEDEKGGIVELPMECVASVKRAVRI